jgi:hypothetical protein
VSSGGPLASKGVPSGHGSTIATKGLLSEAAPPPALSAAQGDPLSLALEFAQQQVQIVIPTATNTCLMASENISANLRVRQASNLTLPSLYKRAYFIAYETDEIAVVK